MVLAQEQTQKMEQNRKPRNGPTTYGQLIFEKQERITNGEKTVSSTNAAGNTGQQHAKE